MYRIACTSSKDLSKTILYIAAQSDQSSFWCCSFFLWAWLLAASFFFVLFVLLIVLWCLVWHCDHLVEKREGGEGVRWHFGGGWLVCFLLVGNIYDDCRGVLILLPVVIGRQCSMIVVLLGPLHYYFMSVYRNLGALTIRKASREDFQIPRMLSFRWAQM